MLNPFFAKVDQVISAVDGDDGHVSLAAGQDPQEIQRVRHHRKPFVIVKADAGTDDRRDERDHVSQIKELSRKQRETVAGKTGGEIHDLIIQEGVHTSNTSDAVAEPVGHDDRYVVGGFYRAYRARHQ